MRRNSLFLQQIGTLESGLRRVHEEESKQKRRPARRNDGHNGCGLGMLPRLAKRKYLDGSGRGPCRNCGWAPTNHRLCNCARHQCGTRSVWGDVILKERTVDPRRGLARGHSIHFVTRNYTPHCVPGWFFCCPSRQTLDCFPSGGFRRVLLSGSNQL